MLTAKGGEVEFFDPATGVRLLTKEFTLEPAARWWCATAKNSRRRERAST